jgi:type I restriction enzyme R subunit
MMTALWTLASTSLKGNQPAIAETIENNVRSKIVKEHLNDPALYERMSQLLDEIIALRRTKAIEYEEYLKRIAELVREVHTGGGPGVPPDINTPGKRALFNNLGEDEALAVKVHDTIMKVRPDGWRGNITKENVIKGALYGVLQDEAEVERIFSIVKAQNEF